MSRVLHLTLKRQWFEMIIHSGKIEEYREVKPYWEKRLFNVNHNGQPKEYDIIRFKNGYGKNVPEMDIEWKGCWKGEGDPMYGAEIGVEYYVIWLGKILSIKNYKQ